MTDFNFRADDTQRFMPWLIGILCGIAALLLCAGITLNDWIIDTGSRYNRSFTVNIPASDDEPTQALAAIENTLKAHPAVAQVARLSQQQLLSMLEPWLGAEADASSLPLPVVYDVTLSEQGQQKAPDYAALQAELAGIIPGVEVDAHERWVSAFSDFSSMTQRLLFGLALLLITGMALMVAFTSRASLKLHARTVALLHSIGAEDRYIVRQFQNESAQLVLKGAAAGSLVAALLYLAAKFYLGSLPSSMIPPLAFDLAHIELLLALPLLCGLLGLLVSRWAVQRTLQQSL